jgi:DNA damage-binding protein 1
MLSKLRPVGAETDHLFIGTQRFQYFTLRWDSQTRQLITIQSFVDISDKHLRDATSADRCSIDPQHKYLVMELFQGILNLVQIVKPKKSQTDYLGAPVQIRISELFVRSATFLHTQSRVPKFAMLYQEDEKGERVRLVTYRVTDDKGIPSDFDPSKDRENDIGDLDPGASLLIPVPKTEDEGAKRYIVRNQSSAMMKAQMGGVIVVGEVKMLYLDDESKAIVECALDEANIFVAWEMIDDKHYLLADDYGRLHLLSIIMDGAHVSGLEVQKIGETSKATQMVYLGDGILLVTSHSGDSQVVRLQLDTEEPKLEIIQTIPNVAPILDFTIMDMGSRAGDLQTNEYSSGQARIVTGSGTYKDGSLRSVRSGVGLDDVGILGDMSNVRELFSLRDSAGSEFVDTLVASFVTETRVFRFDADGGVEEVEEYQGFSLEEHTLLATNVQQNRLLQVTESGVRVVDSESGTTVSTWQPVEGQAITAAAANQTSLLLSVDGKIILSLNVEDLHEVARQDLGTGDQVACLHVPADLSGIGVIGFWKSSTVSIVNLKDLNVIHGQNLTDEDNASVPRNIVLTQVLPAPQFGLTLFVAMADGIVQTFNVDKNDYTLSGKKSIVLGTQHAGFKVLPRENGLNNVFATCKHPSLIYGSEGRIVYSAITAQDAICVCPFNSEAFPDSIVVATAESIKISQVDTERRTHITTLHVGETVRKIAYSPSERVFGIGNIKKELIEGEEIVTSSFRLVDEVAFEELGKPFMLQHSSSSGTELVESVIRTTLPDSHGEPAERFLVGTSFLEDGTDDRGFRGRILVLGVDTNRSPYLIAAHNLKGACRCLAVLEGKIVAALVKTVVIFGYSESTPTSGAFSKLATYRTATCPIALAINGNTIAVGDLMKSISLLEYIPGEDGLDDKLTEVARDFQCYFTTAVCHVEGDSWLESDHFGNLNVLRRNKEGVTESDRKRMQAIGEMSLGENVNKICKVNVVTGPNAAVIPKAFLATVSLPTNSLCSLLTREQTEGAIYLYATIAPLYQDLLLRLQTNMAEMIVSPGNIPFNRYRSFKSNEREAEEPFRFVDGELIERFLDLSEALQEDIVKGLGPSVEDVRNLVEELKRLH